MHSFDFDWKFNLDLVLHCVKPFAFMHFEFHLNLLFLLAKPCWWIALGQVVVRTDLFWITPSLSEF